MGKVLRNQFVIHGRATGYVGHAKTEDELEEHENCCTCRACVQALIDERVGAAVTQAITEALAAATGGDAAGGNAGKGSRGRAPAAHSSAPLIPNRGVMSAPPKREPEPEPNGYGRPLMPGAIRPRKAS